MAEKVTLSDLLAYRDGEPVAVDVQAALAENPGLGEQLQRAIELRHELNALPAQVPAPELWQKIQLAARQRESESKSGSTPDMSRGVPIAPGSAKSRAERRWFASPQLRMATAASVFLVGLLASALWLRNLPDQASGGGELQLTQQSAAELATLVGRSRMLEQAVQSQVVSAGAQPSQVQRALMFRIADLDAELSSLQQESMHPELKERLWRQRVELLETLMEIQRFQMREQADF